MACAAALKAALGAPLASPLASHASSWAPQETATPEDPLPSAEHHVRFLEHMLLEEHVADDRGNSVERAIEGFRAFWPVQVNFVKEEPDKLRPYDLDKELADVLKQEFGAPEAEATIASWETEMPLVVVAGPHGSSPHAVAFLVTQVDGVRRCYYANTGLGAVRCGDAIRTTFGWSGDRIISFVEFARTRSFDTDEWDTFVSFLRDVDGYDDICVRWDPIVNDRLLTLAQYANSNGNIVALPQRGGTCSYNCIL